MDVVQQRAVICFTVFQKKEPKEIREGLVATLGDNAIAYSTVKKWAALLKTGPESVDDDPRNGRPCTSVTY